jgi:hypothetical protein
MSNEVEVTNSNPPSVSCANMQKKKNTLFWLKHSAFVGLINLLTQAAFLGHSLLHFWPKLALIFDLYIGGHILVHF